MKVKLILVTALILVLISNGPAFSKKRAILQGGFSIEAANLLDEEYEFYTIQTGERNTDIKDIKTDSWINSSPLKISDHKGKTIVLVFHGYNFDMPYCRKSMINLIRLYKKYQNNVLFILFTKKNESTVQPFAQEMRIPFPIGTGASSLGEEYGINNSMMTIIIGPGQNQKIWWYCDATQPALEILLDKILQKYPYSTKNGLPVSFEPISSVDEAYQAIGDDRPTRIFEPKTSETKSETSEQKTFEIKPRIFEPETSETKPKLFEQKPNAFEQKPNIFEKKPNMFEQKNY